MCCLITLVAVSKGKPCRLGAKLRPFPPMNQRFCGANRYHPVPLAATLSESDTDMKKCLYFCIVIQFTDDLRTQKTDCSNPCVTGLTGKRKSGFSKVRQSIDTMKRIRNDAMTSCRHSVGIQTGEEPDKGKAVEATNQSSAYMKTPGCNPIERQ